MNDIQTAVAEAARAATLVACQLQIEAQVGQVKQAASLTVGTGPLADVVAILDRSISRLTEARDALAAL